MGLGGTSASRDANLGPQGARLGTLLAGSTRRGLRKVADLAAYETRANPHPTHIDSYPTSLLRVGSRYMVIDAGGNTGLVVDRRGRVRTGTVFPDRLVPAPPNVPADTMPMESVPTAVAQGPDGALYFTSNSGETGLYRVTFGGGPVGAEPELIGTPNDTGQDTAPGS